MDPKLAILFILIGAVLALANLNGRTMGRLRRQALNLRRRTATPLWRRT